MSVPERFAACQSCGFPVWMPHQGEPVCHTCALFAGGESDD